MFVLKRKNTSLKTNQNVRGEKKSEGVESLSIPSAGLLSRQWDHQYERMARTICWSGGLPHIIIFMTLSVHITIVFISIIMKRCSGNTLVGESASHKHFKTEGNGKDLLFSQYYTLYISTLVHLAIMRYFRRKESEETK